MSLAILHSRASVGVDAPPVTVEVHLGPGLPGFAIVGLPEKAVQESKDRVRGALVNSAFDVPQWKVTVNLAPADLPKEGGRFDLPIAVGILAASRQIDGRALDRVELLGELALSGALRPVRGTLPAALATRAAGRQLLLPSTTRPRRPWCATSVSCLRPTCSRSVPTSPGRGRSRRSRRARCLDHDRPSRPRRGPGQAHAKRALTIAAAGAHSLLMVGRQERASRCWRRDCRASCRR